MRTAVVIALAAIAGFFAFRWLSRMMQPAAPAPIPDGAALPTRAVSPPVQRAPAQAQSAASTSASDPVWGAVSTIKNAFGGIFGNPSAAAVNTQGGN